MFKKKNKNKYTWVKKKKLADRWPDRLQGFTTSQKFCQCKDRVVVSETVRITLE